MVANNVSLQLKFKCLSLDFKAFFYYIYNFVDKLNDLKKKLIT